MTLFLQHLLCSAKLFWNREKTNERHSNVATQLASQIQDPIDGYETRRCLWVGSRDDHPCALCWRIGRRKNSTSHRRYKRDRQPCRRAANFSGTHARHSLHRSAQITGNTAEHGTYLVFPVQGGATVKTRTEERRRSLFKVPVFEADLRLDATFDLTGVPLAAPLGAVLDWSQARACRRGFGCPRGIGRWHSYGQRKNRLISSDRQHRRLITRFERQPEPAYTAHALRSYGL